MFHWTEKNWFCFGDGKLHKVPTDHRFLEADSLLMRTHSCEGKCIRAWKQNVSSLTWHPNSHHSPGTFISQRLIVCGWACGVCHLKTGPAARLTDTYESTWGVCDLLFSVIQTLRNFKKTTLRIVIAKCVQNAITFIGMTMVIELHRFQRCSSTIHHLCIMFRVPSFLPSPFIPFVFPCPFPRAITTPLSGETCSH